MQQDTLRFMGMYRYPNPRVLERALASARAWLDEEELYELGDAWLTSFVRSGSTLRIDATLPFDADRFAAGAVLQALAIDALEGIVEATQGTERLDVFPCGTDD